MLFKGYDIPIYRKVRKFIWLFILFWVSLHHIMIYRTTKESVHTDEFEFEFQLSENLVVAYYFHFQRNNSFRNNINFI